MNRKTFFIFLFICVVLLLGIFGGYRLLLQKTLSFECLMGKNSSHWKHVQTILDLQNLDFYRAIYEKNKKYLKEESTHSHKIPKIIHFIWLGPKPFPESSKKNIESWIHFHPDWKIKFWTDRQQPCSMEGIETHFLKDFKFVDLEGYLDKTKNYGEKSDLWRYEILFQEGGVYVDHDVKCYASFSPLHSGFDFYCALEKPHLDDGFTSSIVPAICVIGSKPSHPILKQTIANVKDCWDKVEKDYADNPIKKVVNRTFKSFGEAVHSCVDLKENTDMILPASFLFASEIFPSTSLSFLKKRHLTLAKHFWEVEWIKDIQLPQERKLAQEIKKIEDKNNKISRRLNKLTVCSYLLLLSNIMSIGFSLNIYLKRRKASP